MHSLWQDLRYGVRTLFKSPGFTTIAILSLALGIGANTAIFQLLNAVRLKTLPVTKPQELVQVRLTDMSSARGFKASWYPAVTKPIWEQIRDHQQAFSGIFAWGGGELNLAQGGERRPAKVLWVSGDTFNVLGVRPSLGRLLSPTDDQPGCGSPTAVISNSFWQREYAGDASVIGRKISLRDQPFEVVGVTPDSFYGMEVGRTFDVAIPICADAIINKQNSKLDSGTHWWLMVTGRLKPGWSVAQANAHLRSISESVFAATLPPNYPPISVKPYLESKLEAVEGQAGYSTLRENYERPLWLLLTIAGLVLLIACANLANLLLARASKREKEIAVRQAVGASRSRLVQQLLVESLLLAVMGTALGALLAMALSDFLVSGLNTGTDSVFLDLHPDYHVFAFTAGAAVLTCVLFGLAPALRATTVAPVAAMRAGARGLTAGRERFSLRRALVVLQVALSLVLVAGALLFVRSLNNLLGVDAGFQQDGILITQVNFTRLGIPSERRITFRNEILDRLKAIPGVEAATDLDAVPLTGGGRSNDVWLDGRDQEPQKINASFNRVGSDYFKTLGTPLFVGRAFDGQDAANSPPVAVVNETLARLLNEPNPVGKHFWVETTPNDPQTLYEIVGLVRDAKFEDLRERDLPVVFLSSLQDPRPGNFRQFLVRSRLPQGEITDAVRRVLTETNPGFDISFQGFRSMVEESLVRERLMATLSSAFGVLALLLASLGLYGVLSYGVASRTNEIGIRMALGAQARDVVSLILREAIVLVLVGVAVGVPLVLLAGRFAATLLFGLKPSDPASLILAAALLCVVALTAAYWPARRATKVDPLVALRAE